MRERLKKANEELEAWNEQAKWEEQQRDTQEHNIKVFARLPMERDEAFFRQEQARNRERSKDARARSLAYLKNTKYDRSVVDAPAGSMPGSSSDGAPLPPKEKSAGDREIERIEDFTCRDVRDPGAVRDGRPRDRRAGVGRQGLLLQVHLGHALVLEGVSPQVQIFLRQVPGLKTRSKDLNSLTLT